MDIGHIKDLTPDPKNARKHNPRNIGMIVDSLHEVGAARSIVIDENNRILAGNGTVDAAAEAGITKLQVVDVDGETLVAVRRTGLTESQKTRLALLDNRSAETAEWDATVLAAMAEDGVKLDDLWSGDDLDVLMAADWSPDEIDNSEVEIKPNTDSISVTKEQRQIFEAAMEKVKTEVDGLYTEGECLVAICQTYLN